MKSRKVVSTTVPWASAAEGEASAIHARATRESAIVRMAAHPICLAGPCTDHYSRPPMSAQAPLLAQPGTGRRATRARRLRPLLAVLSGVALAYVLPAGAILRRLVAHREE